MAVHLIISPTFERAKKEILARISANNTAGSSHLVIVPDRHSLSYQKAVIEDLGLVSVSNIEVVSFSRLADLNITKDKKYLTPQSAVMLMRKVINRNISKLKRYQRSSRNVGFADQMFAVVSDIRNSNISADAIESRLEGIKSVAMRNKVSDIAMLYSGYLEELESRYFDATSKFGALIDIIDDIDIVKNSYVYVCDYYEFTNVELELLEKVMRASKGMYISLVEKSKGTNARIFPHLSERLSNMARRNDLHVDIERHDLEPSGDSLIYDNLFGYVNNVKKVEGKPCALHSTKNIEEEISYIASCINESVRDKGLRYRDTAIAVSDIDAYKDTIDTVMRRYNIPYYIDDKVPVMSAPSVRHLLLALDIVEHNYKRSDVTSFLMNGLTTDITNEEKDIFTNYLVKYNIDRSRFESDFTIGDEDLDVLNDIRVRIFKGFDILESNNKVQKMSLHIDSIYDYMDAIGYVDRLNTFAKRQFDLGYKIESEITKQAPKKLFKFFDELMMVAGDEEMSRREFIDILLASLQRVDIALIPKFADSVYIGDMTTSRYDAVREMYFAGMTQGAVPQDMATTGIMGQSEVDVFSALGISLEPSPKEKNLLSRFYILELLLKGKDCITLTYPLEGADGKVKTPSIVMRELQDIYGTPITAIDPHYDIVNYMSTYDNATYMTAENYGKYSYSCLSIEEDDFKIAHYLEDAGKFERFDYADSDNVEGIHDLYFKRYNEGDLPHMSASRIETYLKCPYRAYLQYVVGLQKREVADAEITEIGTILHGMLEELMRGEIAKPVEEKGKLTESELIDFAHRYVEKNCDYEPKIMHELFDRCKAVAVKTYNMLSSMIYYPFKVEWKFDETVDVDGTAYNITGSIDRVDVHDDKAYIVDYKSSSNVPFKLSNIYFGDRVQLVMYADMFKRAVDKSVVGLFYLPMPAGFKKVDEAMNSFKFNGVMSREDLANMSSSVYPVKVKETKKETKIQASTNGDLIEGSDFELISRYVWRLIANVIRDIKDGYIAKSHLKGKCDYCDYANLCGMFGGEVKERKIKTTKIDAFMEEASDEREVE